MTRTRPWPHPWRSTSVSFAMATLAACAITPVQIDPGARAPALEGFGASTLTISSRSPEAQRLFAQGMAQAYAFNEDEAVRAFKAALARDPACAMCAWGVAYQLGPNINVPQRGDLREALGYIDYAVKHAQDVSPQERGLIEALASRYGHASEAKTTAVVMEPICTTAAGSGSQPIDPLDVAYAARMRALAGRFPDDPDIASLYAEAEMIATRDDWWDAATGQPAGRIGEVALRLEQALQAHPDHVGLNHYMIHAVDAPRVAARAEAAADRLGALAPNSPHLVHMPSHTYGQIGRYADATRVNAQAVALDITLAADLERQGFSNTKDWRNHNGHFLWYGAVMEGRGDVALLAARDSAALAKGNSVFAEFVRARPLLTLLRMERWDAVIAEPLPRGDKGMAMVLGESARGTAFARSGQPARAAEALARLDPAATKLVDAHGADTFVDTRVRTLVLVARESLRAELALAEGRTDAAIAYQTQAVALGRDLDEAEPPSIAAPTRLALGDMQLKAIQGAAAERTFRDDLALHPHSGWALRGLVKALQQQGRAADAAALQSDLDREWRTADAGLLTARSR